MADIEKMPHLLIAGATGSGKSVCINTLIMSILFKASPDEVKLLMIDPKVVELGIYNGIPHLLIPVVTDPKKAAGALNWALQDRASVSPQTMERMRANLTRVLSEFMDVDEQNSVITITDTGGAVSLVATVPIRRMKRGKR